MFLKDKFSAQPILNGYKCLPKQVLDSGLEISPLDTESPGINNSGNIVSRYHLNDLQCKLSLRALRLDTSPYSPRSWFIRV